MRLVNVVGARPQFIKVAPILKGIEQHNHDHPDRLIEEVLVHTGQHYDYEMSGVFFDELGLEAPEHHLGVGSASHGRQTGEMLKRIEEVLLNEKPDVVMVYGDTNSTLAGAVAAAKLHIPVAHVEAGLRSFNRRMPEEINRVLTDHASAILFCPTEAAIDNLRREGFTNIPDNGDLVPFIPHLSCADSETPCPQAVLHNPIAINVGDVMYDSALLYSKLAQQRSGILSRLGLAPKEYALATVHRAENTDDPERLCGIFKGLAGIAQEGLRLIVPLHPRTTHALPHAFTGRLGSPSPPFHIIAPVSYLDMLILVKNARVILTDSGGLQKEAFFFQVPCVTLREDTEWVETVETGWNTLAGCDPRRIIEAAVAGASPIAPLHSCAPPRVCLTVQSPYGDGHAAERCAKVLVSSLC